jgi:hypothetical protein
MRNALWRAVRLTERTAVNIAFEVYELRQLLRIEFREHEEQWTHREGMEDVDAT